MTPEERKAARAHLDAIPIGMGRTSREMWLQQALDALDERDALLREILDSGGDLQWHFIVPKIRAVLGEKP